MKIQKNRGQSVLELLIGMSIFVISLSASFQLFFGGQKISVDSANERLGTDYGEQAVTALHSIRARNFSELSNGSHGLVFQNNEWMFSSSSESDAQDQFTRTVVIGDGANENIKIATTTVTWAVSPVQTQTVTVVEQLTNWEEFTNSSCKVESLTGDWANPRVIATGASLGSSNYATDVAIKWPYAYVSSISSTSGRADITVFDVSTPSAPSIVETLDVGSGGINAIHIQGNYLYASSPNDSQELVIINITDPLSISKIGSYNLTGSTNAMGIIAVGGMVAVGRLQAASYEITFLNITNPAAPALISQVATGGDVYDFAVSNSRLYAVSKQSDEDVWIYNITDPLNPSYISYYDITGTTEDTAVFFHEHNGTTLLVGNSQSEIISIGATNTAAYYVRDRTSFSGWLRDITCVGGDLAFIASEDTSKEFITINLADPDNLSQYASLNLAAKATGVDFASNTVFMAIYSTTGFIAISSQ